MGENEYLAQLNQTMEAVFEVYTLSRQDPILAPAAYGLAVSALSKEVGLSLRAACLVFEEVVRTRS